VTKFIYLQDKLQIMKEEKIFLEIYTEIVYIIFYKYSEG